MEFLNIEIKARCTHPEKAEQTLLDLGAEFKGEDRQVDTYYKVAKGRLKMRQGNIENALIHYHRANQEGPKKSGVSLFKTADPALKMILDKALEHLVVVEKRRRIFFIENVKFHIDHLENLGYFIEIEAIDYTGQIGQPKLQEQCDHFIEVLGIGEDDLLAVSYSDMLLG